MKPLHKILEGLLDDEFEISNETISILNNYQISWKILEPMMSKPFERFRKAWAEAPAKDLSAPHIKKNAYGPNHPARYIIDWIAAQPVGMVNDEVFTNSHFEGGICDAFYDWLPDNTRLRMSLTKYHDEKIIYISVLPTRGRTASGDQILQIILK